MEETAERLRRQKVISGEWTESESMQKLREHIADCQERLESVDWKQKARDKKKAMALLKTSHKPNMLKEKEYHFDEGVGVSLDEHVKNLKNQYPQARV